MNQISLPFIALVVIKLSTLPAYAGTKAGEDAGLLTQIVRRDSNLYIPTRALDPLLPLFRVSIMAMKVDSQPPLDNLLSICSPSLEVAFR